MRCRGGSPAVFKPPRWRAEAPGDFEGAAKSSIVLRVSAPSWVGRLRGATATGLQGRRLAMGHLLKLATRTWHLAASA